MWRGLVGEMVFEEMNKTVERVCVAESPEFPPITAAIYLAENHSASAFIGGVRTERVPHHFLALAIDGTDVGTLHLAEMLPFLNALVNAHDEKYSVILRRYGIEFHDDLLVVISPRAADSIVAAVINKPRWMLEAVKKDDVSAHQLLSPKVPHLVILIEQKSDGIEIEILIFLATEESAEEAGLFLSNLPA